MENKQSSKRGFIQIIILAVVIIAILAYFKFDLRAILNKPIIQSFLNIFVVAWGTYIKPLFMFLWTSVTVLFK